MKVYRRRSLRGSTTHNVNSPTNAPAAMIASIGPSWNLFYATHSTDACYIGFSLLLILCYIWNESGHGLGSLASQRLLSSNRGWRRQKEWRV